MMIELAPMAVAPKEERQDLAIGPRAEDATPTPPPVEEVKEKQPRRNSARRGISRTHARGCVPEAGAGQGGRGEEAPGLSGAKRWRLRRPPRPRP